MLKSDQKTLKDNFLVFHPKLIKMFFPIICMCDIAENNKVNTSLERVIRSHILLLEHMDQPVSRFLFLSPLNARITDCV